VPLLAVLLAVSAPAPAGAVTVEQVFTALKVDSVPADYVFLVDYSGSMKEGHRYAHVRSALKPMLASLSPSDYVALVAFAGVPDVRYIGLRGKDPRKILAEIPPAPNGPKGTDIGAALRTALDQLGRLHANDIGAVVLITDGKHNPPRTSDYPKETGRSWDELTRRGRELSKSRDIRGYAFPLTSASGAGLLTSAVSDTVILHPPLDQVATFFDEVKDGTRVAKAQHLLATDKGKSVQVQWPDSVRNLDLGDGPATVDVTLRNGLTHVPVTLSRLSLHTAGLSVKTSGLPSSIELAPGAAKTVPVTFAPSEPLDFHLGRETRAEHGTLDLRAKVATPWARVLQRDLDTELAPSLSTTKRAATVKTSFGTSLLLIAFVVLLSALLIWFVVYRIVDHRRPKLRGSLTVTGPGIPSRKTTLHGRTMKIGKGREIDLPHNGQVTGVRVKKRGRRKGMDLELQVRYGSGPPTRVAAGRPKTIGDINFAYRGV
jgi:hypothetical protein